MPAVLAAEAHIAVASLVALKATLEAGRRAGAGTLRAAADLMAGLVALEAHTLRGSAKGATGTRERAEPLHRAAREITRHAMEPSLKTRRALSARVAIHATLEAHASRDVVGAALAHVALAVALVALGTRGAVARAVSRWAHVGNVALAATLVAQPSSLLGVSAAVVIGFALGFPVIHLLHLLRCPILLDNLLLLDGENGEVDTLTPTSVWSNQYSLIQTNCSQRVRLLIAILKPC